MIILLSAVKCNLDASSSNTYEENMSTKLKLIPKYLSLFPWNLTTLPLT